ncbi:hypothetical protein TNCV_3479001 [Trichonephila clavipes]|nr:hypothetical protein TNCV_3479001 [Trichonephila clavipes]
MVAKVTKLAANLVAKNDANLALSPRFRQVLIESPLNVPREHLVASWIEDLQANEDHVRRAYGMGNSRWSRERHSCRQAEKGQLLVPVKLITRY